MLNLLALLLGGGVSRPLVIAPAPTYIDFGAGSGPLYLHVGDTVPIVMTLRGADRSGQDVTGAISISWTVLQQGTNAVLIDDEMLTPVVAANGSVTYAPGPSELAAGRYYAQVVTVLANGVVRVFPTRGYAQVIVGATLTQTS